MGFLTSLFKRGKGKFAVAALGAGLASTVQASFFSEFFGQISRIDMSRPAQVVVRGTGALKVLSLNVGGAQNKVYWKPFRYEPVCPDYKLCDPDVAERVRTHLEFHKPDILLLQEAQNEGQLLQGSEFGRPVLPPEYDVICTQGASGFREVCTAWNVNQLKLTGPCRELNKKNSGALACSFEGLGDHVSTDARVDAISLHPSAWDTVERSLFLAELWEKLVDRSAPTVIGGDFNQSSGLLGLGDLRPYPAEFGTLFGAHLMNYGRWSPKETFFGTYVNGPKGLRPKKMETTVMRGQLDHVFANFGNRQPVWAEAATELDREGQVQKAGCTDYSCLGDVSEGYEWGSALWSFTTELFGPKTDHRPVLVKLGW